MSSSNQYKQEIEQMQMFLDEIGDILARHTGFVQRASKLTGNKLIQILALGSLENGTSSLKDFCQVAQDLNLEISEAGLHQRLTAEAVSLLKQVCQLWLSHQAEYPVKSVLQAFPAVHIVDATEIRLHPGLAKAFKGTRSAASLKVQLAYEYHTGHIEALEVGAGCQPDQRCSLPQQVAHPGDLLLFDLGYFDQTRFAALDERQVFFISRLQSQVGLYEHVDSAERLDLLDNLAPTCQLKEFRLFMGYKSRVAVRVICYRLAPDVIAERRRKAKQKARKEGKTCSQRSLAWLEWAMFITNVPAARLTEEHVALIYRVRWQIELIFKVWKGEMDFDYMGKWRVERILAQFYGRVIALLLFHSLLRRYQSASDWELSLKCAYRVLKRCVCELIRIVRRHFYGLGAFLKRLEQNFRRFAPHNKRRKNPSTLSHLKLKRA